MRQHSDKKINVTIGQEFLITIKKLGINGEGVGYYKHQVVFVNGALPNEEVVVQVSKIHEKYCEAKLIRIKKRSEHRTKPTCSVYDECGACQLQHLNYPSQLIEKREIVVQALLRHSHFTPEKVEIRECIGMDMPANYRNKSQFQVGVDDDEDVISGLYNSNSHELVDIDNCFVQHEALNKVNRVMKEILQVNEVPIYDEKRKSGIVKTVVARVSFSTGEVQVTFVTVTEKFPGKRAVIEMINKRLPEVVSIFQNVNSESTSLVFGEKTMHLWGKETIIEKMGKLEFDLSARTFFQLNPKQTVKLYDEVKKAAQLTGKERVVDAYCGVGTIGLWLADDASEIRGMDVIPESIDDAIKNAKRNGKKNAQYEVGKAEEVLPNWARKGWKPDVVVVDPPRTGLDRKFMDSVLRSLPKRLVYVSCNPSSLAKDLHYLSREYKVKYIQPVDMFGHTSHVECVVLMTRGKN